ncbi:hypothetical protein ACFQPA_03465 [Halomarina halobia]|uniref:Uncharacterized protein n=1 Tax=Halomarina halobia TaxID=3033386 RepID=A0ABD6A4D7_9EURY|nr:hypothetical protein [Halomarina sp. PSR21]
MNRHFEDAQYYLKRAGATAKKGVAREIEGVQARLQDLLGGDEEPEQSRIDQLRAELKELQESAEGEAKEAIAEARLRLDRVRGKPPAE